MDFNEYQKLANETAIYPGKGTMNGLVYTSLGLGEVGEYQGNVKKVLRDDNGIVYPDRKEALIKELGDSLWYISQNATELGVSLDEVAQSNINKLSSRKERGTLSGSGDNR